MAKPTLTPAQTTSAIVLPSSYPVPVYSADAASDYQKLVSSFPFGIYANSANWFQADGTTADQTQADAFLSGSADQVAYTYRKLGGDVLDIELTKEQVFAAYEEAVLEYSYILNIHQTKNVLSNSLGNTTGSFNEDGMITEPKDASNPLINKSTHMALKYPRFDFAYARRVTDAISEETGVGGATTVYSASINITADKQDYDLQKELADNTTFQALLGYDPNVAGSEPQKFLIKKVFYRTPKAMWRFYGGGAGGLNAAGNLSSYGMYSDDSTYELIPTWHNKLQAQAYEDALNVRVSHYSYELRNNKLRLFPVPQENTYPEKIWIEFVYPTDTWQDSTADGNTGMDGVNNMNTMPLQNIPYKNINSIGKQWIRRFALSLSKEMLGLIRSKFSSIPIPGNDISMNGDALVSSGKEEQAALREELKVTLDELTYSKLMEGDAEVVENSNRVMVKVPTAIFTG